MVKSVLIHAVLESLVCYVDSILYGSDNLKMMGLSIGRKNKN